MRTSLLPDYFVSHEDYRGRYVEVNFEYKMDAVRYIKKLEKNGVEAELWTRIRVFPEIEG